MKTPAGPGRRTWPGRLPPIIYDWNIIPVGQILWLKELESYGPFPPMQDPESLQPHPGHPGGQGSNARISHAGD